MRNKQELKSDLGLLNVLKLVSEAYEEVAVMRMRKIRNSVLSTREFLNGISDVYVDIKNSRKEQILLEGKRAAVKTRVKNGKKVSVLLSTNAKLYGEIVSKVYKMFLDSVNKENTEVAIVGKLGRDLYEEYEGKKPYKYFEIPDVNVKATDLKDLAYFILNFETVNVFYGRFEGFLSQNPVFSNISGDLLLTEQATSTPAKPQIREYYIFEPSLEVLADFFETQIFVSLLKQTINESELSKQASRVRAMEKALENVDQSYKSLYIDQRRLKKETENRKQLSRISGIALWNS